MARETAGRAPEGSHLADNESAQCSAYRPDDAKINGQGNGRKLRPNALGGEGAISAFVNSYAGYGQKDSHGDKQQRQHDAVGKVNSFDGLFRHKGYEPSFPDAPASEILSNTKLL